MAFFDSNPKLKAAVIFGNPTSTTLPPDLFKNNKNLIIISIVVNNVTSSEESLPVGVFSNLPKLEQLHLTLNGPPVNPEFNQTPLAVREGLKTLPSLRGFVMWGAQNVTFLEEDLFEHNPHLELVYLFNSGIQFLPEKLFANQKELQVLAVDSNRIPSACWQAAGGTYGEPFPADMVQDTFCPEIAPCVNLVRKNNPGTVYITFGNFGDDIELDVNNSLDLGQRGTREQKWGNWKGRRWT